MSKIVNRFLKSQIGFTTKDGDWLTINNLTEGVGEEPLTSDTSNNLDETASPISLKSVPRWLNRTNRREITHLISALSPSSKTLRDSVGESSILEAANLGMSVLQGDENILKAADIEAVSLTIPYDMEKWTNIYFASVPIVELFLSAQDSICTEDFLRKVVLSRQVAMLRYRLDKVKIFTVLKCEKNMSTFFDHGWKKFEPDFELILKWEKRGEAFNPDYIWVQAP